MDFDGEVIKAATGFVYLGKTTVGSHFLVDLLELAHKCLLSGLKTAIELVFAANLTIENYLDTYLVAQGFECALLKDDLVRWGRAHLQELRVARVVTQLSRDTQMELLQK